MTANSNIEWTDASWNPVVGCTKVSTACSNCYAIPDAWRMGHNPNPKLSSVYSGLVEKRPAGNLEWTGEVKTLPDRLNIPLHWKKPRKIFVNSQSDLFHEKVEDDFIYKVFERILLGHWHIFQILTKRPERMAKLVPSIMFNLYRNYSGDANVNLNNLWLGVTTENQEQFDKRISCLMEIKAQFPWWIVFLSCEPLLGEINFTKSDKHSDFNYLAGTGVDCRSPCQTVPNVYGNKIDWVILGSESGHKARKMEEDWARWIVRQCEITQTPVFYKQKLDEKGKKISLPVLDGRTWVEFPRTESK